jgi:hypothetical protein
LLARDNKTYFKQVNIYRCLLYGDSGAIQPERTGTPFRFKDFLENGVPVHFGKIQTELTIL